MALLGKGVDIDIFSSVCVDCFKSTATVPTPGAPPPPAATPGKIFTPTHPFLLDSRRKKERRRLRHRGHPRLSRRPAHRSRPLVASVRDAFVYYSFINLPSSAPSPTFASPSEPADVSMAARGAVSALALLLVAFALC